MTEKRETRAPEDPLPPGLPDSHIAPAAEAYPFPSSKDEGIGRAAKGAKPALQGRPARRAQAGMRCAHAAGSEAGTAKAGGRGVSFRPRPCINAGMLPVFVINLDRRPDRWAAMSEQFDRLGIEAARIPAIDGRALPAGSELHITAAERACVLSHRKALEALLAAGAPAALILEDDVELASDTPETIRSADWWPEGHGLLKLDSHGESTTPLRTARSGRTPTGRSLHELPKVRARTGAYLIDRAAARAVLDDAESRLPIDHVLFDVRNSAVARRLRPLQVVPAAVRHPGADSDIEVSRLARRAEYGRRRMPRGAWTFQLRLLLLRCTGRVRRMKIGYSDGPARSSSRKRGSCL